MSTPNKSEVVTLVERGGNSVPLTALPGTPPRVTGDFVSIQKTAIPGRPPAVPAPAPVPAPPPAPPSAAPQQAGTDGKK